MKPKAMHIIRFFLLISIAVLPAQPASTLHASVDAAILTAHSSPPSVHALSYPPDPNADIAWTGGTSGVTDIQNAFNHARTQENSQLGASIPVMSLPSQTEWNSKSDGEKALWLINRERIDRGVAPLSGIESNVTGVAQYYADYLLDNNAWGHEKDGYDPWERLNNNPAIGACHDFLSISENLAVFVTTGTSIALPIERAIYMWMYTDKGSGWGHRHAILWYPYNDNSGLVGDEGFLGIGRANGGPYKGPFSSEWNFAELIVMNVFDPCATWLYTNTSIFKSQGSYDGWVLESSETSGVGGKKNYTGKIVKVGDNAYNRQYRSILSFDTSSIPDDAVIASVKLKVKKAELVGNNPFSTHRGLRVDIRKGAFGASNKLQLSDFQAKASRNLVGRFSSKPDGKWYTANLVSAAQTRINKTGTTQFRLRFYKDDNNDFSADYFKFYSGNAPKRSRPQLIVEYYIP